MWNRDSPVSVVSLLVYINNDTYQSKLFKVTRRYNSKQLQQNNWKIDIQICFRLIDTTFYLQKESCQPFEQLDWKSFLVDWRKKGKAWTLEGERRQCSWEKRCIYWKILPLKEMQMSFWGVIEKEKQKKNCERKRKKEEIHRKDNWS